MKNKVSVRICGKDYAVVGQESDEYMQRVALYVDKKMREIEKSNTKLSTAQAAVLTSINVADEYYKTMEAYNTIEDEYEKSKKGRRDAETEMRELERENISLKEKIKDLEIRIACLETELRSNR